MQTPNPTTAVSKTPMRRVQRLTGYRETAVLAFALLALGCEGLSVLEASRGPSGGPVAAPTDKDETPGHTPPGGEEGPPPPHAIAPALARRLTRTEYNNTVRDLLGDTSNVADEFAVEEEVLGFDNFAHALTVSPLLAEQLVTAAERLATTALLEKILPCDPEALGEAECGAEFVRHFGTRAFRRPLQEEERARMEQLFETSRATWGFDAAVRVVVQVMLQSPQFLYRFEGGPAGTPGERVALTSYEMASALSYLFWGTMPDKTLFEAAAADALQTPEQIATQARRLLADPRAKKTVSHFAAQWLKLKMLDLATKDPQNHPDFPVLRPLMHQEVETFIDHVIWNEPSMLRLLDADYSFMNKALADAYDATGATGDAFVKVRLDTTKRRGLLTQPAFLSAEALANASSPIHRGKFVFTQLLCGQLGSPPDEAADLGAAEAFTTTRERFAEHSTNPTCAGCHRLMDPIGFGLEHFDAVGRYRATENGHPIDATGDLPILDEGDTSFDGAPELATRLAASRTVHECIARQWFRFGMGREEDTAADAHSLRRMYEVFESSGHSAQELMIALTQTDAFRFRTVPAP